MKKIILAAAGLAIGAQFAPASQPTMTGTIVSETSVACGTKKHGKKESTDLLCQQYTVRTNNAEYLIRQPKPENSTIIPADTPIEFTLDKNKINFKANGKKYQYIVVGTSALGAPPS